MQGGQPSSNNAKPFVLHHLFMRRGFSGAKELPLGVWEPMTIEARRQMEALQATWPEEVQKQFSPFGVQLLHHFPEKEDPEKTHYQQDLGTPMFAYQAVLKFQMKVGLEVHEVTVRAASIIYHTAPLDQGLGLAASRQTPPLTTKAVNKQLHEAQAPPLTTKAVNKQLHEAQVPHLPLRTQSAPTYDGSHLPVHTQSDSALYLHPPNSLPSSTQPNKEAPWSIAVNSMFAAGPQSPQRPEPEPAQIDPARLASTFDDASMVNRGELAKSQLACSPASHPECTEVDKAAVLAGFTEVDKAESLARMCVSMPLPVIDEILQSKSCSVLPLGGGASRVIWPVEGKLFDKQDQQHTSSMFKVQLGGELRTCQILLNCAGKDEEHGRAACNFHKTKGKGNITLKCDDLDGEVDSSQRRANVYFSIGQGSTRQKKRGPVDWAYDQLACCTLGKDDKEWDFKSAVDMGKFKKVMIIVEICPDQGGLVIVDENKEQARYRAWIEATGERLDEPLLPPSLTPENFSMHNKAVHHPQGGDNEDDDDDDEEEEEEDDEDDEDYYDPHAPPPPSEAEGFPGTGGPFGSAPLRTGDPLPPHILEQRPQAEDSDSEDVNVQAGEPQNAQEGGAEENDWQDEAGRNDDGDDTGVHTFLHVVTGDRLEEMCTQQRNYLPFAAGGFPHGAWAPQIMAGMHAAGYPVQPMHVPGEAMAVPAEPSRQGLPQHPPPPRPPAAEASSTISTATTMVQAVGLPKKVPSAGAAQGGSQFVATLSPVVEKGQEKAWTCGREGNITKVFWRISATVFGTYKKNHTSPRLKFTFPGELEHTLVIMLKPFDGEGRKRASDFKKGSVSIKCETPDEETPQLEARVKLFVGHAERHQQAPWQDNDFKNYPSFEVRKHFDGGAGVEKGNVWEFWSADSKPKATDIVLVELWIEPRDTASSSSQAFESS